MLRYPRTYDTVAVIDASKSGHDASEFVGTIGEGIPVVASLRAALRFKPEALVIGIAPQGGALPDAWRPELRLALEKGIEVHSGLHTFLGDDPELAQLAKKHGTRIWDVRRPTRPDRVTSGEGHRARALVVHTMGTDCNSGKMTTTVELVEEANRRGLRAAFAATGQTGIMIGCDVGAPIDRVVSDFVAGAAEELVLEATKKQFDLVVVEGQGSLDHPAYSGVTLGLMHGCFPDQVVLCHQPGRRWHAGFEDGDRRFSILSLPTLVHVIEELLAPISKGRVVAVSLMTFHLNERDARAAIRKVQRETGLPATDPVRFGAGPLLDAVLKAARRSKKGGARRLSASRRSGSR